MTVVRRNSEFLTYGEIADRRAIKTESARKLIERRGWEKDKGDNGRMGAYVPGEELAGLWAPMIDRLRARIRHGKI